MDVQVIGEGKVVIYLEADEIPASPDELTTDQASHILRTALGATYDQSWERVCFEMYPGRDSLLLFALQHADSPYYFTFTDVEPLISAARSCPPGLVTYLTYMDERYFLVVYPLNGDNPPYVLWEYGTALSCPAVFSIFLSEHGTLLAGPYALDRLRRVFC